LLFLKLLSEEEKKEGENDLDIFFILNSILKKK